MVNGVDVNGQWIGESKYADLYRGGNTDAYMADDTNVPFCTIGFRNEKAVISLKQDSAPTTDYELHLYRYVPAGIVQIPQEYVEGLEETTANANQALETATAAQSTAKVAQTMAEVAQSAASEAQSTAESSRIAPNAYNYDAIQVSRYGKYKGWFESIPMLEYDKINGKFHKSLWEKDALTHENIPIIFVIKQDNLQLGLGPEDVYMICTVYAMSSSNRWGVAGVGIGEKGSSVTANTQPISLSESTGFVFEYTSPRETILRSSTSGSTKKFKITIGDDARPTFTDTSNPNNTWTPGDILPTVTESDKGKFLCVSESGVWTAEAISNAEEASF